MERFDHYVRVLNSRLEAESRALAWMTVVDSIDYAMVSNDLFFGATSIAEDASDETAALYVDVGGEG